MNYYILYVFSMCFIMAYGNSLDLLNCGKTRYANGTVKLLKFEKHRPQMGRFPWMVRLGIKDPSARGYIFYCAGALITSQYVLSAAHCGTLSEMARIGENNDDGFDCKKCVCPPAPEDIPIKKHLHADHCRMSNINDITLVVLSRRVVFSDFIQPVCILPNPIPYTELKKERLYMSGWGSVYSGFGMIDSSEYATNQSLQYVELESSILDPDECNSVYKYSTNRNQYCVGYMDKGSKPCVGDSGGPLIVYIKQSGKPQAFLVGIASYDLKKCQRKSPLVFTNVGTFRKWLEEVMEEAAALKS